MIEDSTGLTMPQKKVINFFMDFFFENQRNPSYSEISNHLGKARCTAKFHCDAIYKKGILKKRWKEGKGLRMKADGYKFCSRMEDWYKHSERFKIRE